MYAFRFQVIENITKVAPGIGAAFGRMNSQARQFTQGVDGSARSMDHLESESRQAAVATRRVFESPNTARLEASIGRLNGMFGWLRGSVAALGIGAVAKEAGEFGDRMYTANALTAGITRNVNSMGEAQRRALELSNQTGTSYLHSYEGLSKMLTVAGGNVEKATELTRVGAALAALNPAEGFEGALFALKEIEGGDTMSLRERFNIKVPTQEEAKKIAARDGRTIQQVMFDSLQQQLDANYGGGKAGAGVEFLLNIRANTIGGQMSRIANTFQNIFTPLLLPFLEKTTVFLKGIGDWLQSNSAGIGQFFANLAKEGEPLFNGLRTWFTQSIEVARGLWPVVQPLLQSLGRLFVNLLPPLLYLGKTIDGILKPAFVVVARLLTGIANGIGGWLSRNQALVNSVVDGIALIVKAILGLATLFINLQLQMGQAVWRTVQWIGQMAEWAWKNNPFTWMVDLVDRVFPGFKAALGGLWDWIKSLFSQAFDWMYNKVKGLFEWLGNIWTALGQTSPFTAVVEQSVSPTERGPDINDPRPESANQAFFNRLGLAGQTGGGLASAANGLGVSKQIDSISGGGREGVKQITINIGKQVESIVFNEVREVRNIADQVRRELERAMLDAVNQVNYAN